MAGTSLSELQRRVFDRMDEGQSQYVTPAQATDVINEAASILYSIYTSKDPKFFETIYTFTPLINVRDYALPADFRMVTKVYMLPLGGTPATATHIPLNRTMRDAYVGLPSNLDYYYPTGDYIPTYEIYGSNIRLNPTPSVTPTFTISVWYQASFVPLAASTDTLNAALFPGHEQWVINQAVIMLKIGKEEQPATDLMAMNQMLRTQIEADIAMRDTGSGKHVVDFDTWSGWLT